MGVGDGLGVGEGLGDGEGLAVGLGVGVGLGSGTGGTKGTRGVTAFDGLDAGPVPAAFVAVTVNVYDVPFVRPDTVHEVAGITGGVALVVHVLDASPTALTVYPLKNLAPLGAVHAMVAWPSPGVAKTFVGATGTSLLSRMFVG